MNPSQRDRRLRTTYLSLLIGLSAYRLLVPVATDLPLFYDQIYYYYWSLHPDWGYYSKPPVIAWMIAASTALFGNNPWAINLVAVTSYALTAVLLQALGQQLYDRRTGDWAAIAFLSLPLIGFNSLFASTDAPLLLFWTATLYSFWRAHQSHQWRWWLLTGLSAGLGLLSKYNMAILAIGLLATLAASAPGRAQLKSPKPWAAAALALLILSPNLWWNAQHQYISFRHTAEISQLNRQLLHPDKLLQFQLSQIGLIGPILAIALLLAIFRRDNWRQPPSRYLILTSGSILAVISLQALLSRAHINWAAPAYTGATLLAVAQLQTSKNAKRWLTAAIALNLLALSLLYHYHWIARQLHIPLHRNTTPYFRVLGWPQLGQQIAQIRAQHPDSLLLSDSRKLLSYLSYYGGDRQMRVAYLPPIPPNPLPSDHYALTVPIDQRPARHYLYVSENPLPATQAAHFQHIQALGQRQIQIYDNLKRTLHLYWLSGYRP